LARKVNEIYAKNKDHIEIQVCIKLMEEKGHEVQTKEDCPISKIYNPLENISTHGGFTYF
jgi:hypothetical protein